MKEFLSHHDISFSERLIDKDPDALKEVIEKTGNRATPVILVGNETIVGFDRANIQSLLGINQ